MDKLPFALLALLANSPPAIEDPRRLSTLEQCSGWTLNVEGQRQRATLPGHPEPLFDGKSLAHWRTIGVADFRTDDSSILGQTSTGKSNAFLVSDQPFADFLLELDVKNEQPGNSGIQIRSRVVGTEPATSYATGYQIEIDPSARAWSGGLYEERGRGWIQNLEHNEAGRKAFRPGEWNRYRIECVGPWIRAWVNDVPTADALDPESLEGIIGLQVHSGQDTRIRFKNIQLHVFGKHTWNTLDTKAFSSAGARLGNDFGLRLTRSKDSPSLAGFRLLFRGEGDSPNPKKACSFAFDDPRLGNADWKQLTLLAYSDRVAIFRDHQLLFESLDFRTADGPFVWIERAKDAGEALPFERVESIEPVQ